jgi:serine phosphatase RsbU (regulator of sigma subunit)
VGFAWLEPQAFEADQCLTLSLIADLTAQALDRALLHAEVVESASRIRFLQRLTEHFASATSAVEIAEIAVAEVAPLVGASIVNITRVVDGAWIEHVADTERPEWLGRTSRRPLSDRTPSTDAARTGRPMALLSHADRQAAYPDAPWVDELADYGPVIALPAIVHGQVVGTLALVFPEGVAISTEDLDFLTIVCDQVGQSLERVHLLEDQEAHARELRQNLERIQALQRVTSKLATATTIESICRAIVDEGITMIGDYGGVCVADPDDDKWVMGWFTPGFSPELDDEFSLPLDTPMGLITAFRTDSLVIARSLEEAIAISPTNTAAHNQHQSQGILGVPAHANGVAVGAIGMGFTTPGAVTDEVIAISSTFADLLGQALYRASLYERSHRTAHSLQATLLPRLSEVPGLELAARYAPGGEVGGDGEVLVGGDWYEVIDLGSDRVGIIIGDVMGRGIGAAAVMGQLRALARGCAYLEITPARLMEILDMLLATVAENQYATCLYAVLDRPAGTLAFASAGHPMPVLVEPGRPPVSLPGGVGPPLGTETQNYSHQTVEVAPGSLLAVFTDGLIEGRTLDVSAGTAHVMDCLAGAIEEPLDDMADRVLRRMDGHRTPDDDTALLLVRVPARDPGGRRSPN